MNAAQPELTKAAPGGKPGGLALQAALENNLSFTSGLSNTSPAVLSTNLSGAGQTQQRFKNSGDFDENAGFVGSPVKAIKLIRKSGPAGELEDKVTTDFIRLMDLMED